MLLIEHPQDVALSGKGVMNDGEVSAALAEAHNVGMGVIVKEALANGRLTARNDDRDFAEKRRRLEAAAEHQEAKLEEGVRLVHRALADALGREGLAEIATDGKFDPHTQEALLAQPSEAEEGTVIQVLQKGYTLGDRVLRPARVIVSAGADA